jgi:hypothetical protein
MMLNMSSRLLAKPPGNAVLHVHPDKVGSSLLHEVEGPSVDGVPRSVRVVAIDQLCVEKI